MATRSYICIEKENGIIEGVYCHCDGYLTHNGALLVDHYTTKEKVEELLSLGSLSYLGQEVHPDPNEKHSFDYPQNDVVIAYSRDRGEEMIGSKEISLEEMIKDPWIEYIYIFNKEGVWEYIAHEGTKELVKDGLDEEFEQMGIKRPEGVYGYYPPQFIKKIKAMQSR